MRADYLNENSGVSDLANKYEVITVAGSVGLKILKKHLPK